MKCGRSCANFCTAQCFSCTGAHYSNFIPSSEAKGGTREAGPLEPLDGRRSRTGNGEE